jgi:NAD(P)-dependent dehydrogenase (short-subunit alcohol dehydrogenase family)
MKLADNIALITGGTSGSGLEAAKSVRDEGAQVIVAGADPTRLEAAARQPGSGMLTPRADLRTPRELDVLFDQVRWRSRRSGMVSCE